MTAPKLRLVISDGNDRTKSVPGTNYPYLQKVYEFYGKASNVKNLHLPKDQQDYGFSKKVPVYRFLPKPSG
jgi:hypothetical protein